MDEKKNAAAVRNAVRILADEVERAVVAKTLTADDLVVVGLELWKMGKRLETAFEKVKAQFRAEAVAKVGGKPGPVVFKTPDGPTCTVSIPVSKPVVKKGADLKELRSRIGDKFADLFEESVSWTVRKDFSNAVAGLDQDDAKAAMSVVEMVDVTPSVFFKE